MNLFKHQLNGIEFIKTHKHVLLGFDIGLGKSATALVAAKEVGAENVIIFCPTYLFFNWEIEIKKWAPDLSYKIIPYSRLKGEAYKGDFVIIDESQYIKNPRAQRTQVLHNYIKEVRPAYLVLLSGTPIKNRVPEFHSPLKLLSYTNADNGYKIKGSYYKFCDTFSNKIEKRFGGNRVFSFEGMKNVELLRQVLKGKYLRVELRDALDLPEHTTNKVLIESIKENELQEAWAAFNDKKSAEYFSTVKKNNALYKAPFTVQYVLEMGSRPVIIFTDHLESLKVICTELKCPGISGATPSDSRAVYFSMFQTGKVPILAGTIGAMSTGVTLTMAKNVVFNDYPWVGSDIKQAEGRIHRIGQTEKTMAHYILAGKIDQHILNTLQSKDAIVREITKNPI